MAALRTLLFPLVLSAPVGAQLRSLETDDLRLVYFDPSLAYLSEHAARCFESSLALQSEVLGFDPSEPVTVLLKDFSDQGNAAAGAVPRNHLLFDVAPLDFAWETIVTGERLVTLMNHELVHIATMDQAAPSDRFFRKLFRGKVIPEVDHPESILYLYLTAPRTTVPRWYLEGVAVFSETWMAGGIGRAQGAYDEMVFRSMVRDGSHFYDPLGLVAEGVQIDFQIETHSYLYGTRFVSYLAYRYDPREVVRWISRGKGSRRSYREQFREVFGLPLDRAWQEWIDFEHEFQRANLERIRTYPVTPYRDLSDRPLGFVSRGHYDPETNRLYAGLNYQGAISHIGAISLDDGSVDRIVDVKGPAIYSVTSTAYDSEAETLFYTTDQGAFRDLRSIDLETRRARTLIKDARIGDLALSAADRSLWGIRHLHGIATLVRIPAPYEKWNRIRSWPYGEVIYNLDISPDGSLASMSVAEIGGRHSLRVYRIAELGEEGELPEPLAEVEFGTAIPSNFVFSPDGSALYGSSYYTGVSNIFRYQLATGELEALSNTETGFFRPIPLGNDRLIVLRYTGEGFVPATIAVEPLEDVSPIVFLGRETIERHPELREWQVGSPAEVPLEELVRREQPYGSFRSLALESIYPVIEGYKDSEAYGLRLNFSDPLVLNRLNVVVSYSPGDDLPSDERLHFQAELERYNWRAFARYNDADFYDLAGPTKKSRKGYALGLGYDKVLIYDRPRELELSLDSAFYGDIDRLPDYQNVVAPFDKLLFSQMALRYENQRHSMGHVDEEKGFRWEVVAASHLVEGESTPNLRTGYDVGFALPLKHSSIWIRSAAGVGFGDRDDPFANFFFGGFGNNYVDSGEIKRYREFYAFPGLELNEVGGRTFAKSMLEWNLPPLHFRRLGWPGFYVTWVRPALFAGGLVANPDEDTLRRTLWDFGAQIDIRFTLMSAMSMTLSMGYARAFEEHTRSRDELMISIKVLG